MRFGDFKLKVTAKSQLTRTLISTLANNNNNNKNQTRAAFVLNLHVLLLFDDRLLLLRSSV